MKEIKGRGVAATSPPLKVWIKPSPVDMAMSSTAIERFVLRCTTAGTYLRVTGQDEHIDTVSCPEDAWIFHTHEGALTHAIWLGEVLGETPDVVMLR